MRTREVFVLVDGLLATGRTIEAQTVWDQAISLMCLPRVEDPTGSLIWDGRSETDVTGGGLSWRFQKLPHIFIGYDEKVKHSGARALRVDFSVRENSNFRGVCQRVVVEPHVTYELSAWVRTRAVTEGGRVFLRIGEMGIPLRAVILGVRSCERSVNAGSKR